MAVVGPAIGVTDLVVERGGRTVLDDLDFDIAAGRITGLLGPGGCGKTTLMRAIVGVTPLALGLGALTLGRRTV